MRGEKKQRKQHEPIFVKKKTFFFFQHTHTIKKKLKVSGALWGPPEMDHPPPQHLPARAAVPRLAVAAPAVVALARVLPAAVRAARDPDGAVAAGEAVVAAVVVVRFPSDLQPKRIPVRGSGSLVPCTSSSLLPLPPRDLLRAQQPALAAAAAKVTVPFLDDRRTDEAEGRRARRAPHPVAPRGPLDRSPARRARLEASAGDGGQGEVLFLGAAEGGGRGPVAPASAF